MKSTILSLLLSFVAAAPAAAADLPTVKLPYGTYRASEYDSSSDSYTFKNIRFAAPPVGNLRFAKPAPPAPFEGIHDGSNGTNCLQLLPNGILSAVMPNSLASGVGPLLRGVGFGSILAGGPTSEDCLFLDVVVPKSVLSGGAAGVKKLPVVNWIYGGAYIIGSKDQMYDGRAMVKAAEGNIVYVAANYRLGPWGFLAGTTVEKDKSVTANVAFWDQRAVLEWIQKYIHLFGGDPGAVTAMGESAGAGSILHHITQFGGTVDPLFNQAVIQSPAFGPFTWDRGEANQRTFEAFEIAAGCAGQGIACLRSKSNDVLTKAGNTVADSRAGQFGFGPAADGTFVRQNPNLELATGHYSRKVKSLVLSHVSRESDMFVPAIPDSQPESEFREEHDWEYGNNTAITDAISNALPRAAFATARDRSLAAVAQARFTCSVRSLTRVYEGKAYNVVYEGQHGDDVPADFYSPWAVKNIANAVGNVGSSTKQGYQKYLMSFIRTGDPNTFKVAGSPTWPKAVMGESIQQLLSVNATLSILKSDDQNTEKNCGLWYNVWAAATNNAGLAPPDAVAKTTLPIKPGNPSRNFLDPKRKDP